MSVIPARWRLSPSYIAPLGSPLWWVALAVMLLSDNLLKGRRGAHLRSVKGTTA